MVEPLERESRHCLCSCIKMIMNEKKSCMAKVLLMDTKRNEHCKIANKCSLIPSIQLKCISSVHAVNTKPIDHETNEKHSLPIKPNAFVCRQAIAIKLLNIIKNCISKWIVLEKPKNFQGDYFPFNVFSFSTRNYKFMKLLRTVVSFYIL